MTPYDVPGVDALTQGAGEPVTPTPTSGLPDNVVWRTHVVWGNHVIWGNAIDDDAIGLAANSGRLAELCC